MADTNTTSLAIVAESTFGTTPSNGFKFVRATGESLNFNINNTQSAEIRADRNVQDIIRTDASASGDINFELSFGAFDDLLEGLMCADYSSDVLVNGITAKSFSIEKKFELGGTDRYHLFKGMRVSSMSLDLSAGDIVSGAFSFIGKEMTAATSPTDSTITAATTAPIMNAVNNVVQLQEGGSTLSDSVMSLSLTVENNLRTQNAIGSLGAVGIGLGEFNVSGSMSVYFSSGGIFNKFLNGTDSSIQFQLSDGSNSYTFLIPKVEYTSGSVTAGSTNADVMAEMEFTGKFDATTAGSLKITRA